MQKQAAKTRFTSYLSKSDADETILLCVERTLQLSLDDLYRKEDVLKANGQVMYAGGNYIWLKGEMVEIANISFIEAGKSRSYFHLLNGDIRMVTIHLGKIMKVLTHPHLMRIHNSYVININSIKRGVGSDCIFVINPKGKNKEQGIPVSKKYTKKLLEKWLQFGQEPDFI